MRESGSSSLLTLLILAILAYGVVQLGPSLKKQVYQNARESIGRANRAQELEREVAKLKKELAKYKKVEEENEVAKLKKELEEARGALAKKKESEDLAAKKAVRVASAPRRTQSIVRSTYVQPRYVTVERVPSTPAASVDNKSPAPGKDSSPASSEMKAPDLPSEAAVSAKKETAAAKAAAMRTEKKKARAKVKAAQKAEEEEDDEDFFSDMDE